MKKSPPRSSLPEGAIKCSACDEYVDKDMLVWHDGFGWCCPYCTTPDPYWNQ